MLMSVICIYIYLNICYHTCSGICIFVLFRMKLNIPIGELHINWLYYFALVPVFLWFVMFDSRNIFPFSSNILCEDLLKYTNISLTPRVLVILLTIDSHGVIIIESNIFWLYLSHIKIIYMCSVLWWQMILYMLGKVFALQILMSA